MKLKQKQLKKWLSSLAEDTPIYNDFEWTVQQITAVFAQHDAEREAFNTLYVALEELDAALASECVNSAYEKNRLKESDLKYWSYMHHYLACTAGVLWESEDRNVNTELGYVIY